MSRKVGTKNRRRATRAQSGRCAKRMWRDIEQATRAVVGAIAAPECPLRAMAIYICHRCGWYHQSRQTTGRNIVRVIEREEAAR